MSNCLVFSVSRDPHVDRVSTYFKQLGHQLLRINTEELGLGTQLVFKSNPHPSFEIMINSQVFSINDLHSVWIRKPFLRFKNFEHLSNNQEIIKDYKTNEYKSIYTGTLLEAYKQNKFILNFNDHFILPESKVSQLKTANEVGLLIPDTYIGNDLQIISEFIDSHDKKAIFKKLGKAQAENAIKEVYFSTYLITKKQFLNHYKSKSRWVDYPLFVQEEIKKKIELRITIVGNKMFACTMDTQAFKASRVDSRKVFPNKIKHEIVKLPQEIEDKCFQLCKLLDINFGAIDMAITPQGKYIFFEINPNGQYLWIEEITGAPISEAIANLLINPEKNKLV